MAKAKPKPPQVLGVQDHRLREPAPWTKKYGGGNTLRFQTCDGRLLIDLIDEHGNTIAFGSQRLSQVINDLVPK